MKQPTIESHPHTPEQLAKLSTFIHNSIGWILLILSGLLLLEQFSIANNYFYYIWPALGLIIGYGLMIYIFFHQILVHKIPPFQNPVQNQHQLIGLSVGLGSTAEMINRYLGQDTWWSLGWPLALIGVGVAFLLHEQGTMRAMLVHWILAGTVMLAGMIMLAVQLTQEDAQALGMLAVFLLIVASVQLIVFKEQSGAHQQHVTT